MDFELRFFANFREAAGQKTLHRSYDDVETVGDVLGRVNEEFPEMDLFEDDGSIREYATIMRNGKDVTHIDGRETPVSDGDVISAFPPVAGG